MLVEVGVRGREELYGPIDPGPLPDRDAAVAELARRYAAAHAPATAADFAAWSGLPAADVRARLDRARAAGRRRARRVPSAARRVRRVAARLGVARRSRSTAGTRKRVAPGGGIIRPVAIADGRVFATWRLDAPSDASSSSRSAASRGDCAPGSTPRLAQRLSELFSPQKVA